MRSLVPCELALLCLLLLVLEFPFALSFALYKRFAYVSSIGYLLYIVKSIQETRIYRVSIGFFGQSKRHLTKHKQVAFTV
jgi:hypothetical protein